MPRVTFAPTTPFERDTGQIDLLGLAKTMHNLVHKHKAEAVIPAGTTGEFAAMSADERLDVLVATRRAVGPDVRVYANVSSCCLAEALEHTRRALASDAAPDALLLLPPFYHRPFDAASADAGAEAFFRTFLQLLPAGAPPVFFYTFAMHTQLPVTPRVYGRLCADFPDKVGGIKASGVDVEQAMALRDAAPEKTVMVGNGKKVWEVLRAGLHVASGDGFPVAWCIRTLERLMEMDPEGRGRQADELIQRIWRGEMDHHDEVPANKAALAAEVGTSNTVRPPLVALPPTKAGDVSRAAKEVERAIREQVDLTGVWDA